MGHVRKGRQALARRRESAVARQAEERARSASDVPRATGTPVTNVHITQGRFFWAPLGTDSPQWRGGDPAYMTRWEILAMLNATLPPRDPLWWVKNPGI